MAIPFGSCPSESCGPYLSVWPIVPIRVCLLERVADILKTNIWDFAQLEKNNFYEVLISVNASAAL